MAPLDRALSLLAFLSGESFPEHDLERLLSTPLGIKAIAPSDLLHQCRIAQNIVTGSPEECRDEVAALSEEAERLGIGQIAFAKLGPDYEEAIKLLCHRVPAVS